MNEARRFLWRVAIVMLGVWRYLPGGWESLRKREGERRGRGDLEKKVTRAPEG